MIVVIVGCGSIGFNLAKQLIVEGRDLIIIEKDKELAKKAANQLDCLVINKDGNCVSSLKEAQIEKANFFISLTNSDETNILACNLVNSLAPNICKIAKLNNLKYFNYHTEQHPFPWIDYVFNPEAEATKEIINTIVHGVSSGLFFFKNHNVQTCQISIDENSVFFEKTIRQTREEIDEDFIISSIYREGKIIIPSGETQINKGDQLYIVTLKSSYIQFLEKIGNKKMDINRVLVVGGGKIGRFLIKALVYMKKQVKVLEIDYARSKQLSELFPNTIVINGDISDEHIFEEEQLNSNDLIITSTQNQDLNILSALYSKYQGIQKAISVVFSNNYSIMGAQLGIDVTVNSKSCALNRLLTFLRQGNIQNIYSIFDGLAEIIEASVGSNKYFCDKPIKKIKLPSNALILAVSRDNIDYIPDGNFVIQKDDNIIMLSKRESIRRLEKILKKDQ